MPPKVAFNKNTKFVTIDFEEYIKAENALKNPPKGKTKQGGIGYNSFCVKCNSFLGSSYVPAYKNWAIGGMQLLNQKEEYGLHGYTINEIEPLKVIKHIISMFLAINPEWFLESYPELAAFLNEQETKELPDKFRVFMYLTRAERFRYMPFTTHGNLKTGTTTLCSEIAFPPYGYVITFDFNGKIGYLNEITDFKKFNLNQKTSLNMITYQLPTYMQFPLDYRNETKIESDIDSSLRELEILKRKHLNDKNR
ncbi:hypothetical protein [Mangrovimonas sp. DI 80]|uniref:hypothetical protein n=1 Tax=Mangrovimonas sp. DI 80 TaxID=1779330 RepID=UPI000F4FA315|nr:hypothetical protein [Mangrovimonas sp. DI 80]